MVKVVLAPDSFKDCLPADQVAAAMERGVRAAFADADVVRVPMADGGQGTVEAVLGSNPGDRRTVTVTGPLGQPTQAVLALLDDGQTALIEMASASGLELVPPDQRNPMRTTTVGTGELLRAALDLGVQRIIIGIGGSATNDGGAGLAQALGYRLLDAEGQSLGPGGSPLASLRTIDATGRDPRLDEVEIRVACDVDNPLCGPRGASAVYGPQKGATPARIIELDANLRHFAGIIHRDLGRDVAEVPGAGAAGGLGAGLIAFADGTLVRGTELVLDAVGLARTLEGADLCLTGEGGLDASSAFGKTVVGVARLARAAGCPCLALAGSIGEGAEAVLDHGVDAFFSLCRRPMSLDDAINGAADGLMATAEQVVRAFLSGRRQIP